MPSPKRNGRYANGHRRRQVRAQVLAEETHCWLCNRIVDKSLPAGLHGSPEIDEIIPFSLGGSPFDRSNCRLSHRLCNVRRGNGRRHQTRTRVPDFTTTARTDP
jgi:5-methylcytosine-specific restriction endonuclease McrA